MLLAFYSWYQRCLGTYRSCEQDIDNCDARKKSTLMYDSIQLKLRSCPVLTQARCCRCQLHITPASSSALRYIFFLLTPLAAPLQAGGATNVLH